MIELLKSTLLGIKTIGIDPSFRTALYKIRGPWYRARYTNEYGEIIAKRSLALTLLVFLSNIRQPPPEQDYQAVGDVLSITEIAQGLAVQCERGYGTIEAITENIVRLRIVPQASMPPYASYATVLEMQPTQISWRQVEETIRFETPALRVEIQMSPFSIRFVDDQGVLTGDLHGFSWGRDAGKCSQSLNDSTYHYGMGQRAYRFPLRGRQCALYTIDPVSYHENEDPVYINIPFLVGMDGGRAYGMLLDSTFDGNLDLGMTQPNQLAYHIDGPEIRIDFILGPALPEVVERYTELTGRMPMPPLWTLGYHQSRWSYENAEIISSIAEEFRSREIPCEAIHFDIDYMDGFRCFTWNREAFPDPTGLIDSLHAQGFKAVGMIDPGIKIDPDYHVYAEGLEQDVFCQMPDGSLFSGPVWPGECHFPDYTDQRVREWWGGLYQPLLEDGFDGFWNDMNEPTVFDGVTFADAVQMSFDGKGGDFRAARSLYGMQMVRATYEGLNSLRPDMRNWVFTRSAYAGTQRYATSWTGDNYSEWSHLALTPAMLLNLGLSGMAFSGPDVGGFNGVCTPELFGRWISMGAFTPFYRTHTIKFAPQQQPWSFGKEVGDIARRYIEWRYRLLPYLYTAVWQCSQSGMPIMRPLAFEDMRFAGVDDQWLFGDHLLVSPILTEACKRREIQIPEGQWFDFWNDQMVVGPATLTYEAPLSVVPVHVRAGSVLPLGPVRQYSAEKPDAPLALHIYPGAGTSHLYEDDGVTLTHRHGIFRKTEFRMSIEDDVLTLDRTLSGQYSPPYQSMRMQLHALSMAKVLLDGEPVGVDENTFDVPAGAWQRLQINLA